MIAKYDDSTPQVKLVEYTYNVLGRLTGMSQRLLKLKWRLG